jgi:hypothetical protein
LNIGIDNPHIFDKIDYCNGVVYRQYSELITPSKWTTDNNYDPSDGGRWFTSTTPIPMDNFGEIYECNFDYTYYGVYDELELSDYEITPEGYIKLRITTTSEGGFGLEQMNSYYTSVVICYKYKTTEVIPISIKNEITVSAGGYLTALDTTSWEGSSDISIMYLK